MFVKQKSREKVSPYRLALIKKSLFHIKPFWV